MPKALLTLLLCLVSTMTFAQNTYRFTSNPKNADCPWAGKTFEAEGKQATEHKHSTGRQVCYAVLREAQDDIKLSWFSLNEQDEIYEVQYVYITAEQSKELSFGNLNEPLGLDINNASPFDAFETEVLSEEKTEAEQRKINGLFIQKFKSKEAIEQFKKFLQR